MEKAASTYVHYHEQNGQLVRSRYIAQAAQPGAL